MSKSILKVIVLECGTKVKDRTEKIHEIDFNFSNPSKVYEYPEDLGSGKFCTPGEEQRAQIMANGKAEIL